MNFNESEIKLINLALNAAAHKGEVANGATMLFRHLRKRGVTAQQLISSNGASHNSRANYEPLYQAELRTSETLREKLKCTVIAKEALESERVRLVAQVEQKILLIDQLLSSRNKAKIKKPLRHGGKILISFAVLAIIAYAAILLSIVASNAEGGVATPSTTPPATLPPTTLPPDTLPSTLPSSTPRVDVPSVAAMSLPRSGEIRTYKSIDRVAPLQIKTAPGRNYLVKLCYDSNGNSSVGQTVMSVFIRGGDTATIKAPLGRYILKYASGETWYGYKDYFGPSTVYTKADELFSFTLDGNRYRGHTVTLYNVVNGSLSTSNIKADQF